MRQQDTVPHEHTRIVLNDIGMLLRPKHPEVVQQSFQGSLGEEPSPDSEGSHDPTHPQNQ